MIIFWIIYKVINSQSISGKNNSSFYKSQRNSIDYFIIGLMIFSIVNLFIVYSEYLRVENVFIEFIPLFSLFSGFFIIKDILRYYSPTLLVDFLFSIVLVNSLASCFYILHQGLHITIYKSDEYISEIFQGEVITRTFWFMPLLCFLSISYLFVFKRQKAFIFYTLLVINLMALFISYTRSFLVITFILIVLYYLLNAYKEKNSYAAVKNIILMSLMAVILFIAISKLFPTSTDYFFNRFKELRESPKDESSNSLLYRFTQTGKIFKRMDKDKLIFGYGPVTPAQVYLVKDMKVTTWDLVWTGVVFRWGIIGLVLFVLLYVVSISKVFSIFIRRDGIISQLALLFLLVLVSQVIESFISSTFMSYDRYAMGLWYLAMTSFLLLAEKNYSNTTN
jgi:hypothetical protein